MNAYKASFSGFSVNDLVKAKDFYSTVLGLTVTEQEGMGFHIDLPGGGRAFAYPKQNHEPATFTILNFIVEDIDAVVDDLTSKGVSFEHYEGDIKTDEKGIMRSHSSKQGPTIAWFKDPAGNILSLIQQ